LSLLTNEQNAMNLKEWMDATNAHKSKLTDDERARRRELRQRVFDAAGTTYGTVNNAVFRGRIGAKLLGRLVEATANEQEKITITES
jgi:hypothetical protein